MTASEALDIYRKRDSVEKIFRMLKTGLEYDTFRVHSQDSPESKTYVMFMASIVRNYLFQGLKKISKKEKDKRMTFTISGVFHLLKAEQELNRTFAAAIKSDQCQRIIEIVKKGVFRDPERRQP